MLGKFFSLDCDILLRKWIEDTWSAQKEGVTLGIGEEFVGIAYVERIISFFFGIYKFIFFCLFVFKLGVSSWKIEQRTFGINLFIIIRKSCVNEIY